MAFTKSQLEALKNALLASNQPITAPIHREFAQKIIDELYDAQSRANLLSAIQNDSSLLTTDSVFVIRNGQGFLIPSSQVGGTGSLANLTDTVIIDPQDGEVIIYNSVTEKWENRVAGVVFNDFYVRHDIDNQDLDATQKSNATTNIGAQSIAEKGQIDGYASLDGTGRVPSSQLPSFVDDVLEFPTLGDFPETGESGKIYIALDTNKTYRWGGTTYVEISAGVVLGETESTAYRGDRGKIAYDYSQIGHLPLTGGTLASSGSTNTLNIDHSSGSGLGLNIAKAGNGEGLKVVKTSGSGLAASITGGVTLLDELNLTTKLADAHIASADTWNAKIAGTIAAGQVAFGTAAGVIGGDSGLTWNNTTKRLGVGGAPGALIVVGDSGVNNSTLAKILISSTVPASSPYAEHAFSDSSQLENGLSYNSFDARINIKENIIGAGGHYAAFQSVPMIAAAKTLSTYYGHYDGATINGAITNYYANISQINAGTITNYYGLAVTKSGTPTISNVQGVHIGAFNSVNFTGISIAGANGSTQARGISIVGLNGGNVRPIYTEISTAVFAPNEFKYTGSGNKDLLMLSRSAINNNEETGIVWEAGSGATKYYSSRISSSYSDGLKGSIIFYNNKTSGAGINSLVESARINSNGLGIGVTPTARLHVQAQGALSTDIAFRVRDSADTTDLLSIRGNGNIGINTTTDAGFRLDVNGTARIVGATRIDNLAGTGTRMVVADANGVMSTQALGIGGSGTLNRLAKFTAAGTVGDSQVFDNGTNVGIGTDSPSLLFSVLNKVGIDNDGRLFWGSDFSGNNRGLLTWDSNSARIQSGSTSTSLDFAIGTGDIRMRLSTNNNLLINTTTDAGFRLDVNGTGRFSGNVILESSSNRYLGFGTGSADPNILFASNGNIIMNVGVGDIFTLLRGGSSFASFSGIGLDISIGGVRTTSPYLSTNATWRLGSFDSISATPNGRIRVQIGGRYYNIPAEDLGEVPV